MSNRVDVLIVTALQDELDAVLRLEDEAHAAWTESRDAHGFTFHQRSFSTESGASLRVAAAWAGAMGATAAAARAQHLLDELNAGCLAMCGICAGRREDLELGDIVVADRVYAYDHGKLIRETDGSLKTLHDIETYNLVKAWKMDAALLARSEDLSDLSKTRPLTRAAQRWWVLHALRSYEEGAMQNPLERSDRREACPLWPTLLPELVVEGLVKVGARSAILTQQGRNVVDEDRVVNPDGRPARAPIRVKLGAMASGAMVQEDPLLFDRLRRLVRSTIAIEMEGAAIGYVAERVERRSIVVKAVSDHADHEKDDSFRAFACRASAVFLLRFLRRHFAPETAQKTQLSEGEKHARGRTASDDEHASEDARPPPNTLPKRRILLGREAEMDTLSRGLSASGRTVVADFGGLALFGLGGVGKTALALEYCHRHIAEYPGGVWWIDADRRPAEGMARLASDVRMLGLPAPRALLSRLPEDVHLDDLARATRLALQNQRDAALLVLDNVTETGWEEYLPAGNVRVLVTTRDRRLVGGESTLVDVLSANVALELAISIGGAPRTVEETAALERIVNELGNLPVAVEMAGKARQTWFMSWFEYEDQLRIAMSRLLEAPAIQGTYKRGAFAALDLSIDRCPLGTTERAVLNAASAFAPEGVPIDWAQSVAEVEDMVALREALGTLAGLGLVRVDDEYVTLSMHRLVQARVRHHLKLRSESALPAILERASACASAWMLNTVDPTAGQEVDERVHHVLELLREIGNAPSQPLDSYWILLANSYASHLRHRGQLADAVEQLEIACAKADALGMSRPVMAAMSLSNLAMVRADQGDALAARGLLERALVRVNEISNSPVAQEENEAARSLLYAGELSRMATVCRDLGQPAEARSLLERSLELDPCSTEVPRHRDARRLAGLAVVLQELGDPLEAKQKIEQAINIDLRVYGGSHPAFAVDLATKALILRELGHVKEAADCLEDCLRIVEGTYGADHPQVASALGNLGAACQELGDLARARVLLTRAVEIDREKRPDHSIAAAHLSNLASVLHELGEIDGAKRLYEQLLRRPDSAKGKEHPYTALVLNNLGMLLMRTGAPAEARVLVQRAIAIDERIFGVMHPNVSVGLSNLASILREQNLHSEALPKLERALEIRCIVYGESHPSVADSLYDLASVRLRLSGPNAAKECLLRATSIDLRLNPPAYSRAIERARSLASVLAQLRDLAGASRELKRALALAKEGFGADGVEVAMALVDLGMHNLHNLKRPGAAANFARRAKGVADSRASASEVLYARISDLASAAEDMGG